MKQTGIVTGLLFLLWVMPAYAEIPETMLDKDYQACLSNDTDPNRAAYCACIHDAMRGWDMDSYDETATEAAKAGVAGSVPAKIEELAKECIAKVLH